MITSLEIENFKAIGSPGVRIDIKPITLLFGPNSSGKSTIYHALLYLRNLIEHDNRELIETESSLGSLDFGGFRRLVHQHVLDKTIRIKATHSNPTQPFSYLWGQILQEDEVLQNIFEESEIPKDFIESYGMEVEVKWSHLLEKPYIATFRTYINDLKCAEIVGDPENRHIRFNSFNLSEVFEGFLKKHDQEGLARSYFETFEEAIQVKDIIPKLGILLPGMKNRVIPNPESFEVNELLKGSFFSEYMDSDEVDQFTRVVTNTVIGPVYETWEYLKDFKHIGPIRKVPDRDFTLIANKNELSWYHGLAAWKALLTGDRELVDDISLWLSGEERLNAGCAVRTVITREVEEDLSIARLLNGTDQDLDNITKSLKEAVKKSKVVFHDNSKQLDLAPSEVGIGISQLLPVVVASLDRRVGLVMVEQPELHIHPAVQVGLGDLFIEAINREDPDIQDLSFDYKKTLIIETHSEHLMLRLLRRIEETTEEELPPHVQSFTPDEISVNYLDTCNEAQCLRVTPLRIDETGEFIDRWPQGFFDERGDELFR